MKRLFGAVAVVAVLVAGGARAQEAGQEAAAEPSRWSVGAGLGLFEVSGPVLGNGLGGFSGPQAVLSFEYLVREDLALMLTGGAGWGTALGGDASSGGVNLGLGLRIPVSRPQAPVTVSALTLFTAGYNGLSGSTVSVNGLPAVGTSSASGFGLGLEAGLAVEKELVSGLGLRISTMLGRVGYTRTSSRTEFQQGGQPVSVTGSSSAFGLNLGVRPSIELRLAF